MIKNYTLNRNRYGEVTNDLAKLAKLTASDGAINHYFGCSVSISGDNIVVGAKLAFSGENPAIA